MNAGRWLEIGIGFVVPTAALLWILWKLWRGNRPTAVRELEGFRAGVAEFLVLCVFVILVVLAWELFRTWRPPRPSPTSRPPAAEQMRSGAEHRGGVA